MTMQLRQATPSDAAAIAALHRECLEQIWDEQTFSEWAESGYYQMITSYNEGNILGYIVARTLPPEAEILALATAAQARRQGIGGALLAALIETLKPRGISTLFLEVSAKNLAAKQLYHQYGFAQTGLRRNYYADDTDAITMTAILPSN